MSELVHATLFAFSTAFRVAAHHSVANRDRAVEVLVNRHCLSSQTIAPAALVDLPPASFDGHRVMSWRRG